MEINSLYDPYAIHYDSFAGDVYTLDTAGITLTAGTLTAAGVSTTTITGASISISALSDILRLVSSDEIQFQPDGDASDYIVFTTSANQPQIKFVGSNGLITADSGTISFDDEDLSTLGSGIFGTLTDGTATLTGGNLTGMGNITGSDVDISAGTGDYSSSGTITSGDITIFNPTPILIFKDSTSAGSVARGIIEWRDLNHTRLGYFGNSSEGNDDLLWKNESSGGHIQVQTTGAGEFQIFANTVTTGIVQAKTMKLYSAADEDLALQFWEGGTQQGELTWRGALSESSEYFGFRNLAATGGLRFYNSVADIGFYQQVHDNTKAMKWFTDNASGTETLRMTLSNYLDQATLTLTDTMLVLAGTSTVWNDANMGAGMLTVPVASQPDEGNFLDEGGGDTGITTWAFAVGEKVSGSFEIPHDYKEGSDITFHIHWQGAAAPSGTDYVRWQCTYTVGQVGETLDAAVAINTGDIAVVQYDFNLSDCSVITGTNFNIEDQFVFSLERVVAAGAAYAGDALVATVGIHYECDTIGSNLITTK